ncbi:MAG TPA: aspartate--ammonia ligase [Candidatus Gallacutalibacter stercoravium]|nr:aspartate--ammonia ligase [Candidatus Gallacutalibacter stercoravium]
MQQTIFPKGYQAGMSVKETEVAIKRIKDFFERELAHTLHLTRVSAPLFVLPQSGLNDNLNGHERPVSFGIREQGDAPCEIVHSLAKWKRMALKKYGFAPGEGLYTDMNAIRRDEDTDNLHSLYVDQWDWEKIILPQQRNQETLRGVVEQIYSVMKATEAYIHMKYPVLPMFLPEQITFVTTSELEREYPTLTPKQREREAVRRYGAVFLMQIGWPLASGQPHDGRAPDYDDWNLNGDILVDYPLLDTSFEISSMGIRVDAETLNKQLKASGCEERAALPFQKALLNGELPATVGGGIGQSRLCMLFLHRAHIGEVQASVWPEETLRQCEEHGIVLL